MTYIQSYPTTQALRIDRGMGSKLQGTPNSDLCIQQGHVVMSNSLHRTPDEKDSPCYVDELDNTSPVLLAKLDHCTYFPHYSF